MNINNTELIQKCVDGDTLSQSQFYKQYKPLAISIVSKYFNDRDTVNEIVQEGFIKIFNVLDTFEETGSFKSWFCKIIRNLSIDKVRKFKYNEEFSEEHLELLDEESTLIKETKYKDIIRESEKLSVMYGLVFKMYYLQSMQHQEIAEELDINVGTSKSNLHKAKNKIINKLKNKNYN
jgi:RNA polymerase sigma-70 factor (ECF subfamily)